MLLEDVPEFMAKEIATLTRKYRQWSIKSAQKVIEDMDAALVF